MSFLLASAIAVGVIVLVLATCVYSALIGSGRADERDGLK